jgi:ABC-type multidrug transport system ATPase subunit
MLSIKNLNHTYSNGVHALRNVSLEISNGMFGLLGPNGAGKSSLMRTVATLQQPNGGAIQFNDIDVLKEPERLRRVLGYLPQEFGVYPRGTALEILDQLAVMKGLTIARERKSVVDALLRRTNLLEVRNRRLATFSGGMLRRFGIAQALLGNPQLLIVDEPTAGLDPEERNRFYNLLAEIGAEVVVILSTHIVEDVAVLCSNMAIMHEGKVVSQDAPANLKGALDGRIWQKEVSRQEMQDVSDRYDLVSHHFAAGQPVIRVLSNSAPGSDFQPERPNLEDVYFTAIRSNRLSHSNGGLSVPE